MGLDPLVQRLKLCFDVWQGVLIQIDLDELLGGVASSGSATPPPAGRGRCLLAEPPTRQASVVSLPSVLFRPRGITHKPWEFHSNKLLITRQLPWMPKVSATMYAALFRPIPSLRERVSTVRWATCGSRVHPFPPGGGRTGWGAVGIESAPVCTPPCLSPVKGEGMSLAFRTRLVPHNVGRGSGRGPVKSFDGECTIDYSGSHTSIGCGVMSRSKG
jgi:hypothetical protein